jgi:hypothetical protein
VDCEIDGAVDLAEAGASLAGFRIVHDGEKPKRRRRYAAFPISVAQRQLDPLVVEFALDT